mmetsp:Transcript_43427/g.86165  ORF Transcript_43427/g.86165 Transcript_43427/m.86165 type:complete len:569 (+) Transcript_43427:56-1762(+)|eukprot:CAMPEP_0172662974 /NCGR_PEP_ID=MMETSP1074-20121228/5645_1 /TAXON_ID=2916 /ORGANISM="Ceratium fusus, Strain PA161109" /LENGTH=568 /DNA_ID=CAMNT_0013478915 /DNA_START=28 /DNA_END=1734 /DNA_ORIENTATION=+
MPNTKDTGVDYVQKATSDVNSLQDDVRSLYKSVSVLQESLQQSIQQEQKDRLKDITRIHDRISQELATEALVRKSLEEKVSELESKTQNWVGSLGKELKALRDVVATLDTTVAERAAAHATAVDLRFAQIERLMPTKATVQNLEKLETDVALLKAEVDRDRQTAAAAVRSASAAATHDFRVAEDHIERLQRMLETEKKQLQQLLSDVGGLTSKLDSVEAFARTRAQATDLQALEPRVYENERALDRLGYEVHAKAATSTVTTLTERLTNLTMDVQAYGSRTQALEPRMDKAEQSIALAHEQLQTKGAAATLTAVADRLHTLALDVQANAHKAQAEKESVAVQIDQLDKAQAKNERQLDADRDRTSHCVVALERELGTKASKAETDLIGPQTLSTALHKIESRALITEEKLHAHKEEVVPLRTRLQALEEAFPTRAHASEIPKLELALAEQAAKHDALHNRTIEHSMMLDNQNNNFQKHVTKTEGMEKRADLLERKLSTKAEAEDYHTKTYTTEMLRDFYRREEIDAMLSRVWWRVGDMAKNGTTKPGLTAQPGFNATTTTGAPHSARG